MRLLWIKTDFLHPTTRGGQIRTLEILKRLSRRHEVHYLACTDRPDSEGPQRAGEYSAAHYAIVWKEVPKRSLRFIGQLAKGLRSELPVAVARWRSEAVRRKAAELLEKVAFDAVVCDFLFPAINIEGLSKCVLFEHNVETIIWERRAATAKTAPVRWYLLQQARLMHHFEQQVCRTVRGVIAVSELDAQQIRTRFGMDRVEWLPTGVDTEFYRRPNQSVEHRADLVFVGSMDWAPNVDAVEWFIGEIWPLILKRRPQTKLAVVGRRPPPRVLALGERAKGVTVTGTVEDVRPWLHGSTAAVVPLRVGSGTRLKIYEAMAAGLPVISTTVGAEGLEVTDGENIRLADTAETFAAACIEILESPQEAERLSRQALRHVNERCGWQVVVERFEMLLQQFNA